MIISILHSVLRFYEYLHFTLCVEILRELIFYTLFCDSTSITILHPVLIFYEL